MHSLPGTKAADMEILAENDEDISVPSLGIDFT
jgi:hypothetical protein